MSATTASQNGYRRILRQRTFRLFWVSFTLSALGDVMTRVALTWYVFSVTDSSRALGLLTLAYTGPIVVGGLVAGSLLDRFDRPRVMMADNLIRGFVMLAIPILYTLNALAVWHIYIAAAVYGSLLMFTLAGSPTLVPELVSEEDLDTANALETLSYTLSGVIGPPLAGLLIAWVGAPNVIILDVLSYFMFVLALSRIHVPKPAATHSEAAADTSYSLRDAVNLLRSNRILLSTTLMFMAANIALGALFVWLPILTADVFNGGAQLYGVLLAALALGEVSSSFLVGAYRLPLALGAAIAIGQMASGLAVGLIALRLVIPSALIGLGLLGFFSAPLTIWAQTLRMKIIPPHLRGRTFALLRTMMQGTTPAGGAAAGFVLPLLPLQALILLSALILGLPGFLGYHLRALRTAN